MADQPAAYPASAQFVAKGGGIWVSFYQKTLSGKLVASIVTPSKKEWPWETQSFK